MKYYVIEIATGDSKIAGKGVYEYDTLTDATASYHAKMGTAMKSELFETETLFVVNSEGGVHITDSFIRPVLSVKPTVEVVPEAENGES